MSKAAIDGDACTPQSCERGICAARPLCPTRAIWQEEPYDMPFMDPMRCRGCSKCLPVCPAKAIRLLS